MNHLFLRRLICVFVLSLTFHTSAHAQAPTPPTDDLGAILQDIGIGTLDDAKRLAPRPITPSSLAYVSNSLEERLFRGTFTDLRVCARID